MIQPVLARLALDADIVEAPAVPQRHEVAMQALLIELVALLGEDQGLQRILANAARAPELDGFDDILRRLAGPGCRDWLLSRRWWRCGFRCRRGLRLYRTLRHRFKWIRRFRWLLLLRLLLSRGWQRRL